MKSLLFVLVLAAVAVGQGGADEDDYQQGAAVGLGDSAACIEYSNTVPPAQVAGMEVWSEEELCFCPMCFHLGWSSEIWQVRAVKTGQLRYDEHGRLKEEADYWRCGNGHEFPLPRCIPCNLVERAREQQKETAK